jgi:hypothetical protein
LLISIVLRPIHAEVHTGLWRGGVPVQAIRTRNEIDTVHRRFEQRLPLSQRGMFATDDHGKPNIRPSPCGGIVIINAPTQEFTHSGQYWALAYFSRLTKRSTRPIDGQSEATTFGQGAVWNPGGQRYWCSPTPETQGRTESTRA